MNLGPYKKMMAKSEGIFDIGHIGGGGGLGPETSPHPQWTSQILELRVWMCMTFVTFHQTCSKNGVDFPQNGVAHSHTPKYGVYSGAGYHSFGVGTFGETKPLMSLKLEIVLEK